MFIAILSVEIYCWLENRKGLKIRMPDTVPPNVAASFSALLPAIITTTAIATFGFVFHQVTGMYLYDAVYRGATAAGARGAKPAGDPAADVRRPAVLGDWYSRQPDDQADPRAAAAGAITVNMSAFEQGKEVPNIITMPFWDVYMSIGGSGLTIGLLIAVMIATKRKEMKEIAKLSIGPGIFNINEPVIFGMPVMLNPIPAIPFIITPLVTGSIGYFATVTGFAGKAVVMVPRTTPPLINAAVHRGLHGGGDHPVYLHRDRGDYLSAVCENCLTPRRSGRTATSHR